MNEIIQNEIAMEKQDAINKTAIVIETGATVYGIN